MKENFQLFLQIMQTQYKKRRQSTKWNMANLIMNTPAKC